MDGKSFSEILKYTYVIIFDKANGNKLHRTSCPFVREEGYDLKVNKNHSKNGHYVPLEYYEDTRDASVMPCKVCKPTQKA
jgi:hypothetical protein